LSCASCSFALAGVLLLLPFVLFCCFFCFVFFVVFVLSLWEWVLGDLTFVQGYAIMYSVVGVLLVGRCGPVAVVALVAPPLLGSWFLVLVSWLLVVRLFTNFLLMHVLSRPPIDRFSFGAFLAWFTPRRLERLFLYLLVFGSGLAGWILDLVLGLFWVLVSVAWVAFGELVVQLHYLAGGLFPWL
jgi:hypothetical protein